MGGSASRELEQAQAQVRRLTSELKLAQQSLRVRPVSVLKTASNDGSSVAVTAAAGAAEAKLELQNKELLRQLSEQGDELAAARQRIKGMTTVDLPSIKQEVAQTKEELRAALLSGSEKAEQLTGLQEELRASKAELEELFGRLKFAETEGASVLKLRTDASDEKRILADQQKATAEAAARAVAEASAALDTVEAAQHAGAAGAAPQGVRHPVFGALLHDFGHKRVYLGSPTTLWAGTVLWERQRAFRQERATLIANAKARSSSAGWPGAVSVVETFDGGHGATAAAATADGAAAAAGAAASPIGMLIDGQHRLGAAHVLSQRNKLEGVLAQILVEVYPPMEDARVKELFVEINRAEPVLLIDMPEGGASESDNAKLTTAAEVLRERYPEMFKASHNCRAPHVNVDVLREQMHKAELLGRLGVKTAEQLIEWIEGTNALLATRTDAEWSGGRAKTGAALEKALGKAREHRFFLGLSWDWLEDVVVEPAPPATGKKK